MKKATLALSALAVAATVSTALAHTKAALGVYYCVAYYYDLDEEGNTITVPLPYDPLVPVQPAPCTFVLAVTLTTPTNPFTMYGYVKTTPPDRACQFLTSCPAIRAIQEL